MKDQLNVHLHDGELLAEIDLVGELMIAAAESEEPLGDETIDEVLGVQPGEEAVAKTGDSGSRPAG